MSFETQKNTSQEAMNDKRGLVDFLKDKFSFKTTSDALRAALIVAELNEIKNPDKIEKGTNLNIPNDLKAKVEEDKKQFADKEVWAKYKQQILTKSSKERTVLAETTPAPKKVPRPTPTPRPNPKPSPEPTPRTDENETRIAEDSQTEDMEVFSASAPKYLLGVREIHEAPMTQELSWLDKMKSPEVNRNGYIAILIAGKRGDDDPFGGTLTDTIKQIVIDPKTGVSMVVDIPRDLAVKFQTRSGQTRKSRVNTVNHNGAPGALKSVVEEITGQPTTHEVVMDLDKLGQISGELLKILGGKLETADPFNREYWDEAGRYYPAKMTLTTQGDIEAYLRFRKGYEVKPSYAQKNAENFAKGIYPKPDKEDRLRLVGSSVDRSERQSAFLSSVMRNLKGANITDLPTLLNFASAQSGIDRTEMIKFGALYTKMQPPTRIPVQYKNYNGIILASGAPMATISIDPNRIREQLRSGFTLAKAVASVI